MTFSKPDSSCVGMKRRRKERKRKKETVGTGWEEQGQICMNEWNREKKRERRKMGGLDKRGRKVRNERKVKKKIIGRDRRRSFKRKLWEGRCTVSRAVFYAEFELGLACAACLFD